MTARARRRKRRHSGKSRRGADVRAAAAAWRAGACSLCQRSSRVKSNAVRAPVGDYACASAPSSGFRGAAAPRSL